MSKEEWESANQAGRTDTGAGGTTKTKNTGILGKDPTGTDAKSHETEGPELRLARYLKEFVLCRTTVVREIDRYESVLWFSDMPQEPDCQSGAWSDDRELDDAWLEVKKQKFEPAPGLPDIVRPWVEEQAFKEASPEIPPLSESIYVPDREVELAEDESAPLIEQSLAAHPEVRAAYEDYRLGWKSWSKEYRRRQAIQEIYAELFRLRAQLLKQGEIFEVVLGLGLLSWRAGTTIRRHVVVGSVELKFEADKGVIRVEPAGEGARLRIEHEMLEADSRPARSDYEVFEEQLKEIGDEVWDKAQLDEALRTWAHALSSDAEYSLKLDPQDRAGGDPVVSFAPALILRRRPHTGMQRVYDDLIDQLSGDSPAVPKGWLGLVKNTGFGKSPDTGRKQNDAPPPDLCPVSELYFPLPSNREQKRIVEALNAQRGVLVQGPPGTGKSQTIANLLCHLLATGKRVLVTAETPQALRVVKDKIPKEFRPLCISLLGHGGDAFAELNRAVQAITERQASHAHGVDDDQTAEIERDLEEARRDLARTDAKLRSLREGETSKFSVANGAYSGTPSAIAQCVAEERAQYEWLSLTDEASDEPPLPGESMMAWLDTLRRYDEEQISQAGLVIPPSGDLLAPEMFATAVNAKRKADTANAQNEKLRGHPAYLPLHARGRDHREEIACRLRDLERQRLQLALERNTWLRTVIQDSVTG